MYRSRKFHVAARRCQFFLINSSLPAVYKTSPCRRKWRPLEVCHYCWWVLQMIFRWLHFNCNGSAFEFVSEVRWQLTLRLRHNGHDGLSNYQPHDCLLNRLFRRRSKKTSKLRDTGLCAGNSPGTGEFPAQMGSNAENVSIWWRHHEWVVQKPSSDFWHKL